MTEKNTQRKQEELELLFDISVALHQQIDLHKVIRPMLKVMSSHMGMERGTLTLFNRKNKKIYIEEAYGLSTEERLRGKYRTGEGVTGRVVETGEPMIIEKISQSPLFLNKTMSRTEELSESEISFVCVPIKIQNEVIGTLSIDRLYNLNNDLDNDLRLLSIISSMIAQTAKQQQVRQEQLKILKDENLQLQDRLNQISYHPENMIGNSNSMKKIYELIHEVSKIDTTVLIRGESGVGKELIAQAIHQESPRKNMPFVEVNCSAIPDTMIESELFGHEKGSFTGASYTRIGKFESATGGTIFLDEIGDFSLSLQVKLLRVLQQREFTRIGSNEVRKLDVRIIAATNRNLEELIQKNHFREDFYYRINVFPLKVPPLRERKNDIPLLADFFIKKFSTQFNKPIKRISTPAIDMLMSYHWPGNIRELENCIEHAVILSKDHVVHSYHLPPTLQVAEIKDQKSQNDLKYQLDMMEKEIIMDALKIFKGNCSKAAKYLNITERQMGLRVRKFDIIPKLKIENNFE